MKTKKFKSYSVLVGLVLFGVVVGVVSPRTYAAVERICDAERAASAKTSLSFDPSLRATGAHFFDFSMFGNTWYRIFGSPNGESMGCLGHVANKMRVLPSAGGDNLKTALTGLGCDATDPAVCKSITNSYYTADGGFDREGFARGKSAGSLLGFANAVTNTMRYEPVPVNTAFFFRDYLARIPVIGQKAYAQNQEYGHTLINKVVDIWAIFRNIAYAMMSLVMLWTGFAIITRRRISAQTVVNVQYAMPKIVIALILIAFSYPIGAMITSFSWTLWNSSDRIIQSLAGSTDIGSAYGLLGNSIGEAWSQGDLMLVISAIFIGVYGAGALLSFLPILLAVNLFFYLWAYFKALWIYVKMVMSTATSPIIIALYAVPGNDDKLEEWLKQMFAWGIGLFGMKMVMDLTQSFVWVLMASSFTLSDASGIALESSFSAVSGGLFAVGITPMILIFGYAQALQVPSMIEKALMGPPKRK